MSVTAATTDLASPAFLSQQLQRPVGAIIGAAHELGIVPRFTWNGLSLFDGEQQEQIRDHLAKRKAAK